VGTLTVISFKLHSKKRIFEPYMLPRTKLYFASDVHLGALGYASSREREDRFVRWLDSIKEDAAEVFLVGDIFDFWFEYKTVVPKGYLRLFGKLAELTDAGIKLYFFKGNHDMWMYDYFVQEFQATIISDELVIERQGKKLFLHHGDGLGEGDNKYKFLKKVFRNPVARWLFRWLHPDIGVGLANNWSQNSRLANGKKDKRYEEDRLINYSQEIIKTVPYNYIICGHHHYPLDVELSPASHYINLGEWIYYNSYAVMEDGVLTLEYSRS
jgi:UDP-2,3-diacylglucosamine hydrolase